MSSARRKGPQEGVLGSYQSPLHSLTVGADSVQQKETKHYRNRSIAVAGTSGTDGHRGATPPPLVWQRKAPSTSRAPAACQLRRGVGASLWGQSPLRVLLPLLLPP